jgi:hypothetical protein
MNLFSIFGREVKPDPLITAAEDLVDTANILAVSSYTKLITDLPSIPKIDTEQWDWVFTIAAVFVAINRLNSANIDRTKKDKVLEIITRKLKGWKPDAIGGFDDCRMLYNKTYDRLASLDQYKSDPQFLSSDSLGNWIAWNLLGHAPQSEDEMKLTRLSGAFVARSFCNWWKAN